MSTPIGSRCGLRPINSTSSGTRSALARSVLANQHTVRDAQAASRQHVPRRIDAILTHISTRPSNQTPTAGGQVTTRLMLLWCRNDHGHRRPRAETLALTERIARRQRWHLRPLLLLGLLTMRAGVLVKSLGRRGLGVTRTAGPGPTQQRTRQHQRHQQPAQYGVPPSAIAR